MTVMVLKQTTAGTVYAVIDSDGRAVGTVERIHTGPRAGIHYYPHWAGYRPQQIRKLFRAAVNQTAT